MSELCTNFQARKRDALVRELERVILHARCINEDSMTRCRTLSTGITQLESGLNFIRHMPHNDIPLDVVSYSEIKADFTLPDEPSEGVLKEE